MVIINPTGSTADPSAILDVNSSSQGILFPRLSLAEIQALTAPANGLVVFCTSDNNFYVFLADSVKTRISSYVLPFRITAADADSILDNRKTNVVGTMFENMLFGNYWHGGSARIERPGKADSTVKYFTKIPSLENQIWSLKTSGPTTLVCNGYYKATTSASATQMKFVKKGNKIIVSASEGSSFEFQPDGESTYNNAKKLQDRKLFLKYKYTDPGNGWTYHCTDTMTFRNRIRDGINEWQDENPAHYE